MIYNADKNGKQLSRLGFGCMRLPSKGGRIDNERAAALIRRAAEAGVNYFDTAYIYPGSEVALGYALSGGLREKVNIATKMPLFLVKKQEDFNKFFEKQLERLKTNYVDYYLMHMFVDFEQYETLKLIGLLDWIKKEKDSGRIKNIGFSFHGVCLEFKKIVDAYNWDFCMIQYNYVDETRQAGTEGLKYAHNKGLSVMIMEPLRGGKLVTGLPNEAQNLFKNLDKKRSFAEWGLKWVWNHEEVTLLLSGMSSEEQLEENLRIASDSATLTDKELSTYGKVEQIINGSVKVPCTGCGYCMPCPAGVNIPGCFSALNEMGFSSGGHAGLRYVLAHGVLPEKRAFASQCKKCGKCEKHCPQSIKVMDMLAQVTKSLEPFWVKPFTSAARLFIGTKRKKQ